MVSGILYAMLYTSSLATCQLRKFGRAISSRSSGSTNQEEAIEPHTESEPSSNRYDHRSASEPSQTLKASLPHHLIGTAPKRNYSIADHSFSGLHTSPGSSSGATGVASADELGLSLLYSTEDSNVDLIFVHGLGGSSRRTWSWNRDTDYFWPSWLPHDPELSNSRIFTFGYSANLRGPSSSLNVIDFAKDLLLRMLTFSGGREPWPAIGSVRRNLLVDILRDSIG